MPDLIDTATPDSAKTRTGFDNHEYELVFSDEFNVDGRSFYPGDDPFWEAVDLWYWATADQEWYDPGQITTANGSLRILMENVATNGMPYRSGMLQSWNKFCFTTGYIEVSVSLPGPDQNTQGYVGTRRLICWQFFFTDIIVARYLDDGKLGEAWLRRYN
jgi:beta-glucanase (GH16 family)